VLETSRMPSVIMINFRMESLPSHENCFDNRIGPGVLSGVSGLQRSLQSTSRHRGLFSDDARSATRGPGIGLHFDKTPVF